MSPSSLPSQVKAILALTSIARSSVHIEGGWATGKSVLAIAVVKGHVECCPGDVWMVSDSQESDFHLASSLYRSGPAYLGRVRTLVHDEYADAVIAWRDGDLASPLPALAVFDDADRYSTPAHQPLVPSVWVSNPGAHSRQAAPHDFASFALRRSRARDVTIATMRHLGMPGVAEVGSRANIALRSPFYRRATEALVAAINDWGLACVVCPAQRQDRKSVV